MYTCTNGILNISCLCADFRGLVPVKYRNISTLNLLHWTTPFNIWNSSCSREIQILFQIMPDNEFLKGYNVTLIKLMGPEPELQEYYEPVSEL